MTWRFPKESRIIDSGLNKYCERREGVLHSLNLGGKRESLLENCRGLIPLLLKRFRVKKNALGKYRGTLISL